MGAANVAVICDLLDIAASWQLALRKEYDFLTESVIIDGEYG